VGRLKQVQSGVIVVAMILMAGGTAPQSVRDSQQVARSRSRTDSTLSSQGTTQRHRASSTVHDVTDVMTPNSWWDAPVDADSNRNCVPDYMETGPCKTFVSRVTRTSVPNRLSACRPALFAYPPRGVCSDRVVAIISPCSDPAGVKVTLHDRRRGSEVTLPIETFCAQTLVARMLDLYDAPAPYVLTITIGRRQYSRVVTLGDDGKE
jgi:hypothetical protein